MACLLGAALANCPLASGQQVRFSSPAAHALYLSDEAVFVDLIPATDAYQPLSIVKTSLPQDFSQPVSPSPAEERPSGRVSDYKNGFFQKLAVTGTWLYGDGGKSLEITELETGLSVALPAPTVQWPLLITLGFNTRLLEGPPAPALPPRVYDAYLQTIWVPKISEEWSLVLAVRQGLFTDFKALDSDSYRVTGWGVARYDLIPGEVQFLLGAAYLGRDDFPLLPVGGAILDPHPDTHLELVFPKLRLAQRVFNDEVREHWVYTAAEFGGDTWSIKNAPGTHTRMTLGDIRIVLGYEEKRDGGAGWRAEMAYVFNRRIELSGLSTTSLPDTFLLRTGLAF